MGPPPSTMWELYKPSRRRIAPWAPGSAARSYSSRIESLYAPEECRRVGRAGETGGLSLMASSWARAIVSVMVIVAVPSPPWWEDRSEGVSQLSLTDRGGELRPEARCA